MDRIKKEINTHFGGGGEEPEPEPETWNYEEELNAIEAYNAYIESEVYSWSTHNKNNFKKSFFDNIKDAVEYTNGDSSMKSFWLNAFEAK
jgi:hypothetical protein